MGYIRVGTHFIRKNFAYYTYTPIYVYLTHGIYKNRDIYYTKNYCNGGFEKEKYKRIWSAKEKLIFIVVSDNISFI